MTDNPCRTVLSAELADQDSWLSLSLDSVLEVLADQQRRFALYTLVDAPDDVVEFADLTEDVATLEAGLECAPITRHRYQEIAADLWHWHLPVLADVGVVEWDDRNQTLRYRGSKRLETWLHRVRNDELD